MLSKQGPQIVFGDSMGEMGFYYALSSLVIMGGSFENYGCQSVIEPCAIGLPVIVGPSIFNFDFIVKKAESEGVRFVLPISRRLCELPTKCLAILQNEPRSEKKPRSLRRSSAELPSGQSKLSICC